MNARRIFRRGSDFVLEAILWFSLLVVGLFDAQASPGTVESGWGPYLNDGAQAAVIEQPGGGLIVFGDDLQTLNFNPVGMIFRLHPDGTPDPAFAADGRDAIFSVLVQFDGKIVVVSDYLPSGGGRRSRLSRLTAGGELDAVLKAEPIGRVYCAALQADERILIAGNFTHVGEESRDRLARLEPDGTLDPSFRPQVDNWIEHLLVQRDGKILILGRFDEVAGAPRPGFARLNADGTLDEGFRPDVEYVAAVAQAEDGRLVVGGEFTTVGGVPRRYLARLNADGTLDSGFNPDVGFLVSGIALQTDGKVLVSGSASGSWPASMARLRPDGTRDTAFNSSGTPSLAILPGILVQADGKVVVLEESLLDTTQPDTFDGLRRLLNDPATGSLSVSGSNRIEWLRGGASPEAQSVVFDWSGDSGVTWTRVGVGRRIPGGWELTGLNLPARGLVRGRACIPSGGAYSGLAEAVAAFPFDQTPKVANPIADVIVDEDGPDTFIDLGSVFSDAETAAPDLVFAIAINNAPDRIDASVDNAVDRLRLRYHPNQFGGARITVRATDAAGQSVDHTFQVTIKPVSDDPGDPDPAFGSSFLKYNLVNGGHWMAEETDGKVLVDGAGLARLNADGILEGSLSPNTFPIYSGSVLSDGKILIGGAFASVAGTPRNGLARLHRDGTLDPTFDANLSYLRGAQVRVNSALEQADGKILIGGSFDQVGGVSRPGFARLNSDGTLDAGFTPPSASGNCLALQTDGKILLDGARFNSDGTPDAQFARATVVGNVYCLALQGDGKVLLGGDFTSVNGRPRNYIARLNADGGLDASFDPNAKGVVDSVSIQADGGIVLGGEFDQVGGVFRTGLARLTPEGALDGAFNPIFLGESRRPGRIYSTSIQGDGRILVGGLFLTVDEAGIPRFARLVNGPAAQRLTIPSPNRVEWLRGGSSPETQLVRFDFSADQGVSWTFLGTGTRIEGGWELTGLSLPARGRVRARARVTGGKYTSSGWVEVATSFTSGAPPVVRSPFADLEVKTGAANVSLDLAGVFEDSVVPAGVLSYAITGNSDTNLVEPTLVGGANLVLHFATNRLGSAIITVRATEPGGQFVEDTFLVKVGAGNRPPVVSKPILDQLAWIGRSFRFSFPTDAFTDPDPGQTLSYSVVGLPPGLNFEAKARLLTGTPIMPGRWSLQIVAADNGEFALSATNQFVVLVRALPEIDDVRMNAAGELELMWTDDAGGQLQVETANSLEPGAEWHNAGNGSMAADGNYRFRDTPPGPNGRRFYRLKVP